MIVKEAIINFFVGGTVVSLVTILAKYVNHDISALIWAAPIILLPTVLLLYHSNVEPKKIGKFVHTAIPFLFLTVVWQSAFIFLLFNKFTFYSSILYYLLIWCIFAYLWYNIKMKYIKKETNVKLHYKSLLLVILFFPAYMLIEYF